MLSSIFTIAVNDQVIFLHPCIGVATPPVVAQPLAIVTPAEFNAIVAALPDEQSRLLAEVAIEGGLRWGELAELRAADLDASTGMLTVARTVAGLRPKYHPRGGRFLVKRYPDEPRPGRTLDTDGHIPRDWFRQRVWKPALQAARIIRRIRVQDLRHAHASWALAGGADLQTVRERLGHAGLRATERYLPFPCRMLTTPH